MNLVVFVYRNVTKKCWSVRSNGKVLFHTDSLMLEDCTFKVSEAGRQRVIARQRKSVHAGVEGTLTVQPGKALSFIKLRATGKQVCYNPYKNTSFISDGQHIEAAQQVYFTAEGHVYCEA